MVKFQMDVSKSLQIITLKKRKHNCMVCIRSKKTELVILRKEGRAFQNWK